MEQGAVELINLLKAFVEERPLSVEEMRNADNELADVLHLAKINNVLGIWAYKIFEFYEQNGVADCDQKETAETAYKIYYRTITLAEKRISSFEKLSKLLCDAKIDHLIFKGIKIKDLYPVPFLRTFGDIDFIIRPNDRERCHNLMLELSYDVKGDFEPVYTYQKEMELYEIHTSIMAVNFTDRADYIEYFSNLWNFVLPVEKYLWEFSLEYHFVYLLSHIAKHIYGSGAGIRMYLDLAFYIKQHGKNMDWNIIQNEVETLQLERFLSLTLTCIRRWFGISSPVSVCDFNKEFLENFESFTLSGGTFGFEGINIGQEAVRKQSISSKRTARYRALKKAFFPCADTIKSRYTYLEKRPLLLPVAWVDRFIKNHKKLRFKLKVAGEIMKISNDVIEEKKDFYKEMGL